MIRPAMHSSDVHPVKVLFIGGYGRSGSTLVDRILGGIEGFASVGEVRHIWSEGFIENRLCGCGTPFRDCRFWRRVMDVAFGGMDRVDLERVLRVKAAVDRWWRIPQIVSARPARFRKDLGTYGAILASLYRAIRSVSGAQVLVDSTKDVSHGYVIGSIGEDVDVRVLHLVRDSRAVAYSWWRRAKFNPGSGRAMDRYAVARVGLEWDAINALAGLHRVVSRRYLRLRYEDLVRDPRQALSQILSLVDEGERALPVRGERTIELRADHTVAGNPIRFARGLTEIRGDEEWQRQLPSWSRAVVTTLTAPVLVPLGYPLGTGSPSAVARRHRAGDRRRARAHG